VPVVTVRKRTNRSARQAGARFEKQVADYLALHVDDRVERRAKNGVNDRGDITGLRHMGMRIVIECKNTARMNLSTWASEVEIERGNDDAEVGLIAHKRHGNNTPGDQWVSMTLRDLVALLTGERPDDA